MSVNEVICFVSLLISKSVICILILRIAYFIGARCCAHLPDVIQAIKQNKESSSGTIKIGKLEFSFKVSSILALGFITVVLLSITAVWIISTSRITKKDDIEISKTNKTIIAPINNQYFENYNGSYSQKEINSNKNEIQYSPVNPKTKRDKDGVFRRNTFNQNNFRIKTTEGLDALSAPSEYANTKDEGVRSNPVFGLPMLDKVNNNEDKQVTTIKLYSDQPLISKLLENIISSNKNDLIRNIILMLIALALIALWDKRMFDLK